MSSPWSLLMVIMMAPMMTKAQQDLHCHACLEWKVLETGPGVDNTKFDSTNRANVDNIRALMFDGLDPGPCDSPSNVTCPRDNNHRCMSTRVSTSGLYNGVAGSVELWMAGCVDITHHGFIFLPEDECLDTQDALNLNEIINVRLTSNRGRTCGCKQDLCNNPTTEHSDVQCYTCMDVNILETDRTPDSTAPDLKETLIDVIFKPRGIELPPPCDKPALLHCPVGGRPVCHSYRATYNGTFYGVHGKVENIMAYCIYLDNPAYPTLEADTCVPLKEAYPETTYLDGNLVIDDNGGTVCTCDQYGCNHPDELERVSCHECMDTSFTGGDPDMYESLKDTLRREMFGDVIINTCSAPSSRSCQSGNTCYMEKSTFTVKYGGEKIDVMLTMTGCGDTQINLHATYPPDNAHCHQVSLNDISISRRNMTGEASSEYSGVSCVCKESLCNNPQVLTGPMCHHCLDISTDVDGVLDPLLHVLNDGKLPPPCSRPGVIACPRNYKCLSASVQLWGSYKGSSGYLALRESRCIDLKRPEYRHYPDNKCKRTESVVQPDLFGWVQGGQASDLGGVVCTCSGDYCNKPPGSMALQCHHCLDVDQSSPLGGHLYRGLVVGFFHGVPPPACDNPRVSDCELTQRETCIIVETDITAEHNGESQRTRLSMYTCATRESPLINVIDEKCYDINKGLNIPLIAEGLGLGHYQYHLKGHTCACDFLPCQIVVDYRHCLECADVHIGNEEARDGGLKEAVEDMLKKDVFRGDLAPTCSKPAHNRCQRGSVCQVDHSVYTATYNGIETGVNVSWSRCYNRDVSGIGKIQARATSCTMHDESHLTQVNIHNTDLHSVQGGQCYCMNNLCNKQKSQFCHECLDIDVDIGDEDQRSSVVKSVTGRLFRDRVPPTCESPSTVLCPMEEAICSVTSALLHGHYAGEPGAINVTMARCVTEGNPWLGTVTAAKCTAADNIIRADVLSKETGQTINSVTGVICGCDQKQCNTINKLSSYHTLSCSRCKDVTADFGDESVNRQVEAAVLVDMFDDVTPWCSCPGQVQCDKGSVCSTVTAVIIGNFATASGRVTLADHTCMDHTALSRLRDEGHDTNRTCLDLTQAMFSQLYGEMFTRRFSVVSSIRGELCFCHKDLCNLPEREEQIKKPSAASTSAMSTTCYVTMVIMVIYMSLQLPC